jgi:hypothetical protein
MVQKQRSGWIQLVDHFSLGFGFLAVVTKIIFETTAGDHPLYRLAAFSHSTSSA